MDLQRWVEEARCANDVRQFRACIKPEVSTIILSVFYRFYNINAINL